MNKWEVTLDIFSNILIYSYENIIVCKILQEYSYAYKPLHFSYNQENQRKLVLFRSPPQELEFPGARSAPKF